MAITLLPIHTPQYPEHFLALCSLMTGTCTEQDEEEYSCHQQTEFELRGKTNEMLHLRQSWKVLKLGHWETDQNCHYSFQMLYYERMEKISWTHRVKNKKVL
jgi:hypothetical protein